MRVSTAFAVTGLVALTMLGGVGPAPVMAQDGPTDRVVARVDGVDITEKDIALAYQEFQDSLQQMPPEEVMSALINGVIDIRLMARAAEAAGTEKDADTARVVNFARDRALRSEYLRTNVFAGVTEEAVKQRYAEDTAKFVPGDEVHAAHILVTTEEEAKAIIAQLDQGGDFAAIAKEKSTDAGSGEAGGDLGFFGRGRMVAPFDEAAFALEVGVYTKTPVKSEFGFHIIKVLEKRKETAPSFEEVQESIAEALRRDAFFAEVEKLRKDVKIEIIPPPEAPAPETPPADAPATDGAAPAPEAPPAP